MNPLSSWYKAPTVCCECWDWGVAEVSHQQPSYVCYMQKGLLGVWLGCLSMGIEAFCVRWWVWQITRQLEAALEQPKGQSEFQKEAWQWSVPVGGGARAGEVLG